MGLEHSKKQNVISNSGTRGDPLRSSSSITFHGAQRAKPVPARLRRRIIPSHRGTYIPNFRIFRASFGVAISRPNSSAIVLILVTTSAELLMRSS